MIEKLNPNPGSPVPGQDRRGILYVISAPSGAGKTSLCREIMRLTPAMYQSISYTTRPMRAGEQEGVDYHFVTPEEFEQMVAADDFAEWAEVHGNRYGTAKKPLQRAMRAGRDVLLDIDIQGASQLRQGDLDGVFIFILPPDLQELRKRLEGRNTDSDAVIERRMANARGEIAQATRFDYLVVNDVFEEAVKRIKAIMLAESIRTCRVLNSLTDEFSLK